MKALTLSTLVGALIPFSSPRASVSGEGGFIAHQSWELTGELDSIDGRLEVIRDRRLTESDIRSLQEHDPDRSPERAQRFQEEPIRPASLVLRSPDGHVVGQLLLEKAFAKLEAVEIARGKRVFLVTQDFGIGMGSYNGLITRVLDISPFSIRWAVAEKRLGKQAVPISLLRSLKSAWNFASGSKGRDILAVHCRPTADLSGFTTTYYRYQRKKDGWAVSSRKEHDPWESEDGDKKLGTTLPEERKFPPPL